MQSQIGAKALQTDKNFNLMLNVKPEHFLKNFLNIEKKVEREEKNPPEHLKAILPTYSSSAS